MNNNPNPTQPRASRRMRHVLASLLAGFAMLSAPGAQAADERTAVRYEETVRSLQYTPAYIALTRGYFEEAGLDVTMRTAQGTDKAMAALLADSADIALLGPEAVVYVSNSESPVKPKIISGLVATDGFLLVSRDTAKASEDFDWNSLRDKTVMAFRPGSTPDVYLENMLNNKGLKFSTDLTIVNNISPAARMGAWMSGQADYAIFMEPEAGNIERSGHGAVVASVGNEIGQVDYTVFAATDRFIKENPEVVQAWVNAIARALKAVATETPADLAKDVAPHFPGLSEEDIASAIERYRSYKLWKTTPLVEEAAFSTLQDMLSFSGTLPKDKHVDHSFAVAQKFAEQVK